MSKCASRARLRADRWVPRGSCCNMMGMNMPVAAARNLLAEWSAQWPAALAVWSRFVQLHEPIWCFTEAEEAAAQLSDSFAMIRLVDHSVVISLRLVDRQ